MSKASIFVYSVLGALVIILALVWGNIPPFNVL